MRTSVPLAAAAALAVLLAPRGGLAHTCTCLPPPVCSGGTGCGNDDGTCSTVASATCGCDAECVGLRPPCAADCTEADLRAAVAAVNSCGGDRTIYFDGPSCTGAPTVIPMTQRSGATLGTCSGGSGVCGTTAGTCTGDASVRCGCNADCHASCGTTGDGVGNAVCLRGSLISIDGQNKVRFAYQRPPEAERAHPLDGACCRDQCGTNTFFSALFAIKGEGNTVRNFEMEYFPEGIHIRSGNGHAVSNVRSTRVCDDVVSVAAGSGHRIQFNTFLGRQQPGSGEQECWVECTPADPGCTLGTGEETSALAYPIDHPSTPRHWKPGICGRDKILQINGGSSTIQRNRIDTPSNPVQIRGGSHELIGNSTTGNPALPSQCQAYIVGPAQSGPISATFRDNAISYCRYGIDLRPQTHSVEVTAVGNTMLGNSASAFRIWNHSGAGVGSLVGHGNLMIGIGTTANPRGAVLVEEETGIVDLRDSRFCRGTAPAPDVRTTCAGGTCAQIEVADSCFQPTPWIEPQTGNGVLITNPTSCSAPECLKPPQRPFCSPSPLECRQTSASVGSVRFHLSRRGGATNRLKWSWSRAADETTLADYGDPATATHYGVCVYAGGQLVLESVAPAGSVCSSSGAPCWKPKTNGWKYKDRNQTPDGLSSVDLLTGPPGRGRHRIKGAGANLPLPTSLALPAPVVVQLQRDGGGPCWGAAFPGPPSIRRSDLNQFDARH